MSSLIIFNLPNNITKMELMKTFSQKGSVTNIQIIFSVENECCFFALITFQTEEEAKITQNYFNKTTQYSSRISIERCTERIDNEMVKSTVQHPKVKPQNNEIAKYEPKEPTYNMSSYLANSPHRKINLPSYLDKLPHTEGQWSVINQTGRQIYSKSFMLSLENKPICLKEPMETVEKHLSKSFNNVQTVAKKTEKKNENRLIPVTEETITNVQSTLDIEPVVTSTDYLENQEVADKINLECETILDTFSQMQNLEDIVHLLTEDKGSAIRTRHQEFVKTMILTSVSILNSGTVAGKIFTDLISYKHKDNIQVLSVVNVTQGINAVLKNWNDYLIEYPLLVSYIADIITQLLISKTACFEINNLYDCCISLCHEYSMVLFTEILKKCLFILNKSS
ncbi:RNA recognition motif domain [Cinara cedri]|uniref:RNA recognition motif domain n=1 Tax=Cinara cedri TaxID=506608 RepID=A0A5E4NNR5_9HEMI|nr:RNA recognition motif domain [Cinara cedri]